MIASYWFRWARSLGGLALLLVLACGSSSQSGRAYLDPAEETVSSPTLRSVPSAPSRDQPDRPTLEIVPFALYLEGPQGTAEVIWKLQKDGSVTFSERSKPDESPVVFRLTAAGQVFNHEGKLHANIDNDGVVAFASAKLRDDRFVVDGEGRAVSRDDGTLVSALDASGDSLYRYDGPPEARRAAGLVTLLILMMVVTH